MEKFIILCFKSFDLLKLFSISEDTLVRFVSQVRKLYNSRNPYHNFQHAFQVFQATYSLLVSFEFSKYLSNMDILSVLLAALCHDIDHPGVNNAYLIKSRSPLAVRYNDVAVLENHHACTLFTLLQDPSVDVLKNLNEDDFRAVRKTIIDIILGTDMECHFRLSESFEKILVDDFMGHRVDQNGEISPVDRILIMQLIVKASDLSNIALPFEISALWCDRVGEEFFCQGDLELKSGLSPPPFMNRQISVKAKVSLDFMTYVGRALFAILNNFAPQTGPILAHIDLNIEILERKLETGEDIIPRKLSIVVHRDHIAPQPNSIMIQNPNPFAVPIPQQSFSFTESLHSPRTLTQLQSIIKENRDNSPPSHLFHFEDDCELLFSASPPFLNQGK